MMIRARYAIDMSGERDRERILSEMTRREFVDETYWYEENRTAGGGVAKK